MAINQARQESKYRNKANMEKKSYTCLKGNYPTEHVNR